MREEKHFFEIEKMSYKTYEDGETKNVHLINIEKSTRVFLDGILFSENAISKIKIFKHQGDKKEEDCIFVKLYMGNMDIATKIYSSDIVILTEYSDKSEDAQQYVIRKAERYDYPSKG